MLTLCLFLFILKSCHVTNLAYAFNNTIPGVSNGIIGVPSYYDDWCTARCSNLNSCNQLFNADHLDLELKLHHSMLDGPGAHLEYGRFHGDFIRRQTYETQFILDIATALEISPCAIYILGTEPGQIGHYFDFDVVFIRFRLFEVSIDLVKDLSRQVQIRDSPLYSGKVTNACDLLHGLVITEWDFSLKLMYSIDIIGGLDVEDINGTRVLRQGGYRQCIMISQSSTSSYCEFERFFRMDMSNHLQMAVENIEVLLIKSASEDGILVYFRIYPPEETGLTYDSKWTKQKGELLSLWFQSKQFQHLLNGNVTFRVDPTYGVSGENSVERTNSTKLRVLEEPMFLDDYERCKWAQRCPRASASYNIDSRDSAFYFQFYSNGEKLDIPMFCDFEDWRVGSHGWLSSFSEYDHNKPRGAHWSPFDFTPMDPITQNFEGMVLNSHLLKGMIKEQEKLIEELDKKVKWADEVSFVTSLGANFKSRQDISNAMFIKRNGFASQMQSKQSILTELSRSQCLQIPCNLLFNSSNLVLSGAISANGTIAKTKNGTEVAVWTFSSINLDSNVYVSFTGQRAIALLSRSSVHIDTQFVVLPGTLGGMPGGFSVSRSSNNQLRSICSEDVMELNKRSDCEGDEAKLVMNNGSVSNNVNGIGSPSLRTYEFRMTSSAKTVHAVQSIRTNAAKGQRITGGFMLHFRNYSTPYIIHDVDPYDLKRIMEDSLNPSKVNNLRNIDRRNTVPGIGMVSVSRNIFESSGGFEWKVTFLTAIGNMDGHKLTSTNLLTGATTIDIIPIINGNEIGGSFSLTFLGQETRPFMHNVSGVEMENALVQDIPDIVNVSVVRTECSHACLDGFCQNGPSQSGGHTWKMRVATKTGNVSPTSPTSSDHRLEGVISELKANNNLTGCIRDQCPEIIITPSTDKPYSLSYGGGGAGYGGRGGNGFSHVPSGFSYGDEEITDLLGGSGGALGISLPNDVHLMGLASRTRGGSGGGAIEIVAMNDIVLGPHSKISCDAENGWSGFRSGGGGGSGGSILIAAGGTVTIHGKLSVKGGNGGVTRSTESRYKDYSGGGGSGGRIAVYGETLVLGKHSSLDLSGGKCNFQSKSKCAGMEGTMKKYLSDPFVAYKIDTEKGAQGTSSSLILFGNNVPSDFELPIPSMSEIFGPFFQMKTESQPERISFYVQFATDSKMKPTLGWRYSIVLLESIASYDVRALDISFGNKIEHGEIVVSLTKALLKRKRMIGTSSNTSLNSWIKVDMKFDWKIKSYSLYLDDISISKNSRFGLSHISAFGISKTESNVNAWFDEIYVGMDGELGFQCPRFNQNGAIEVPFGEKRNRDWTENEKGMRENSYEPMVHHESHLSERKIYKTKDAGGMKFFDGSGHIKFSSEVRHQWKTVGNQILQPGTMLKIEDENNDTTGYIWYGEYHSKNDPSLGGIGSCLTTDMKNWKNIGIMLHNTNITDMVRGHSGPLHIERPKILYNSETKKYVMWFIVDNENRSLAMTCVATSDDSKGPFVFVRSFYPDGNKTRDFNLFQDEDGSSYLIRTFYNTIEYLLPTPVMDPIWESVKNSDGSTNFGLTYHRAFYHTGYDDYDDIRAQRWSGEDQPWKVLCIDRITETEREIPYGAQGNELCTGPFEMKVVIGQGDPKSGPIRSRYLDPSDPKNNEWKPSSVPGLKAQSWQANVEDYLCGIREKRQGTKTFHPMLDESQEPLDSKFCRGIVDNPIHSTNPDSLIGKPRAVEKRTAKFIAVSRLTPDYLDTTGALSVYEGELEEGADLSFIVSQARQTFGWNLKNEQKLKGTYSPPVTSSAFQNELEPSSNQYQYQKNYNDQAEYSLHSLRI